MKRLKLNTWGAIYAIFECVMFTISWFIIFGDAIGDALNKTSHTSSDGAFFYVVAWIGVVLYIATLVQSKRYGISLVGSVLSLIGSVLFGFTAAMAFPAIVLLIIGCVFLFLQHPSKNNQPITK
ncbi:transporter [Oenococcus alcoholitolerans]|uniref:transporter n=1 Tax=Oenococcus alcoholitolerans TaxID=931074 RepID=UPI003F71F237